MGRSKRPRFVIQRHDASNDHYDFRLEAGGKLKSWVLPKGPSTDPSEQRLALPTFDHEVSYIDFEGVIDSGYGEGTVIVWDTGTYENLTTDDEGEEVAIVDAIDRGHLAFSLDGHKISGGYALNRMAKGENERWLLVKADDEHADARRNPTSTEPKSAQSGRTLAEVAADPKRHG